jgi:hypothetical protein
LVKRLIEFAAPALGLGVMGVEIGRCCDLLSLVESHHSRFRSSGAAADIGQ